jgi:hypothetical protein
MIPPRPPDYERGREHFKIRTSPAFDALAPAEAAAQHTLQFLFNPARAARLVEFHARNAANPSLEEVLDAVITTTWKAPRGADYGGAIARTVDDVALYDLLALATNDSASPEVRAIAAYKAHQLKAWLGAAVADAGEDEQAHRAQAIREMERFEREPKKLELAAPNEPPDGPPIGSGVIFGVVDDPEPVFPGIS